MNEEFEGFSNDQIDPSDLNGLRAVIQIKSEKVFLLVANVNYGKVTTLYEDQKDLSLSYQFDSNNNLNQAVLYQLIEIMIEYRDFIFSKFEVIPVLVLGCSLIRNASNRIEILWVVEESTGYRIRILTQGEEEELQDSLNRLCRNALLKYPG